MFVGAGASRSRPARPKHFREAKMCRFPSGSASLLRNRTEAACEAKARYGQKHSRLARLERFATLLVSSCSTAPLDLPQAARDCEPIPVRVKAGHSRPGQLKSVRVTIKTNCFPLVYHLSATNIRVCKHPLQSFDICIRCTTMKVELELFFERRVQYVYVLPSASVAESSDLAAASVDHLI